MSEYSESDNMHTSTSEFYISMPLISVHSLKLEDTLSIFCKVGLVVMNSYFCLSGKVFFFFFPVFLPFVEVLPQHMEVPRLGVQLEL